MKRKFKKLKVKDINLGLNAEEESKAINSIKNNKKDLTTKPI